MYKQLTINAEDIERGDLYYHADADEWSWVVNVMKVDDRPSFRLDLAITVSMDTWDNDTWITYIYSKTEVKVLRKPKYGGTE